MFNRGRSLCGEHLVPQWKHLSLQLEKRHEINNQRACQHLEACRQSRALDVKFACVECAAQLIPRISMASARDCSELA